MITLNLALGPLTDLNNTLKPKIDAALKNAAQSLAMQAHAHLLEQVQEKLHSTRERYVDAVNFQQVNNDVWVISLDQSAMWLEEGMDEREMIAGLLKSPKAKMAKDGSKYLSVPFQHNKGPTQQTSAAQDLTATVRQELQKRQIPYGKIERDESGKAKLGLLHKFDIMKDPVKSHEGAGQGHGPVGSVRQGMTGIPFLQSVRVYQRQMAGGAIKKGIMTFRTVSSKHKGTGRWVHPGIEPRKFFDETADWALSVWPKIASEIDKAFV